MSSINKLLFEKVQTSFPIEKEKTKESNNQLTKASSTALHILSRSSDSSSDLTASTDTPPITPVQARAVRSKIPRAISNVEKALDNLIEAAKAQVDIKTKTTLSKKQSSSTKIKQPSRKKQDPSYVFGKLKEYYQKYFGHISSSSRLTENQLLQIIKTAFFTEITDNKSHTYYLGFNNESIFKTKSQLGLLALDQQVLVRHKKSGKIRFYLTIKNLGEGTFGVVDKVLKFHSSRTAALKTDKGDGSSVTAEYAFFKKFKTKLGVQTPIGMQEAPKVIKSFNSKIGKTEVFGLLSPVYNLGSLNQARSELTLREKVAAFHQLLQFFIEWKALEISHADIKPGNILVDNRDGLKAVVADWGSAKFKEDLNDIQDHTAQYTLNSDFLKRIETSDLDEAYEISHLHDIFSMGCTFFYLFTGKEVCNLQGCLKNFFAISFDNIDDLYDKSSGKKIEELLKGERVPPSITNLIKTMLSPNWSTRKTWQEKAEDLLTAFPIVR